MAATEPPSPRSLARARRLGNVPHSTALTGTVATTVLAIALALSAASLAETLRALAAWSWQSMQAHQPALDEPRALLRQLLVPIAAGMAAAWSAAVAAGLVQTRFNLTPPFVARTWLRPALPSTHELGRRTSALVMAAALTLAAGALLVMHAIPWLATWVGAAPRQASAPVIGTASRIMAVMFVLSALATAVRTALRRHHWWRSLHRSPDEATREARSAELSPELRRALRARARQAQQARHVRDADVVAWLIDPSTRRALAIAWAPPALDPPHVAAHHVGDAFSAAVQTARASRRPVIAAPVLTRDLAAVDAGHPVPERHFDALAAVFSAHHVEASTASSSSSSANNRGISARKQ